MDDLQSILTYPFDCELLLRKQRSLKRRLLARENVSYLKKKVAILGGTTTADIKNILEIFLLAVGIKPLFYESEYNKFYEDSVFNNPVLDDFRPEMIIVFTSVVNLVYWPDIGDNSSRVIEKIDAEYQRYETVWKALSAKYTAIIIQNNFDLPYMQPLGNFDASRNYGLRHYIESLNEKFAIYAAEHDNFYIHDIHYLSAKLGLEYWHNRFQYYAYKFAMNYDVIPEVSWQLAKVIKSVFGRTKKCLVLDLDNTLWGGTIGDDGMDNIQLGHETPIAEAYTEFQRYVLALKKRGIILAVCSKNEDDIAKSGFSHPDSVLRVDDFIAFKANWKPKNLNIEAIAKEINIGIDSIVFIDDNPVERQLVRESLPMVAVPEVDANDVFSYIRAIEGAGYFETTGISADDLRRSDTYYENRQRQVLAGTANTYEEFLHSLKMEAEIASFKSIYFDRIAQLTNKANQFNLTTYRCTRAEIEYMAGNRGYITLYGRLKDKFGDNGLVSVVIGEQKGDDLHICLWLMSCRVLKRGMEEAMLDKLVEATQKAGCESIIGYYYPTAKNRMVKALYAEFGFSEVLVSEKETVWKLNVSSYHQRNKFINIRRG